MQHFQIHNLDLLVSQLIVMMAVRLSNCQDWIWLGGEKMADRNSNKDHPGGRSGSSVWVDQNGTMWLFAGNGFSDLSAGKPHVLNDVWSFSLNSTDFKLQHPGTWTSDSDPTLKLSEVPNGRQHAALCGDNHKLVMFGGFGEGGSALDDLWTYDTLTKVWSKIISNSSSNIEPEISAPAARGHSSVWCHESFMYLFGGMNDNKTVFSDLWRLSLSSLKWTRLGQTLGKNSLLYPSGRNGASTWLSKGVFYMFSGNSDSEFSYTFQHTKGLTSDLWQYYPNNDSWQTVTVTSSLPHHHHAGHSMSQVPSHTPGSRISAGTWTDSEGNLWLFGGAGSNGGQTPIPSQLLSDIWRFHVDTHTWELMEGGDKGQTAAKYGDLRKHTPGAFPGARTGMMVWQGQVQNLAYVFGGLGHDGMNIDGYLNDLWSVDVNMAVTREYMISPLSLFLFLGLGSTSLAAVLILAMCSRQRPSVYGNGLKLNAEYIRVENEES